jgi:hypothetical protein
MHDTPKRSFSSLLGMLVLGPDTIDHDVPFHSSISEGGLEPVSLKPTAMQNEGLVQLTDSNSFVLADALGVGTIDHVVPFHCSARVWKPEMSTLPTAMQLVGVEQATLLRKLLLFGEVSALGTTDQVWPFHVSTSVWLLGVVK